MPEVNRFATIHALDAEAKGRLLTLLVARQINGGETSCSRRDRRHQRFDQIAFANGVDMVNKWRAPVAFYDRLKKPVIAKIMTEVLGKPAADNCAKMKKGELASAPPSGWQDADGCRSRLCSRSRNPRRKTSQRRSRAATAMMKSSRKPKPPDARGGRADRPAFVSPIQVRAPRPCWTGRRPLGTSSLESARQLMAAAPLSREG